MSIRFSQSIENILDIDSCASLYDQLLPLPDPNPTCKGAQDASRIRLKVNVTIDAGVERWGEGRFSLLLHYWTSSEAPLAHDIRISRNHGI